jgi:cytochrome c5
MRIYWMFMMKLTVWVLATTVISGMAFAAIQNDVDLPDGEGKAILETACSACHGLDQIVKNEGLGKQGWQEIVDRMVRSGAAVKNEQVTVLTDYLAQNFGEGRKILDTKCTTCHSLDEVKKFRPFYEKKDWQDIVITMIKYGADVKESQIPVLVEYLARPDNQNK